MSSYKCLGIRCKVISNGRASETLSSSALPNAAHGTTTKMQTAHPKSGNGMSSAPRAKSLRRIAADAKVRKFVGAYTALNGAQKAELAKGRKGSQFAVRPHVSGHHVKHALSVVAATK